MSKSSDLNRRVFVTTLEPAECVERAWPFVAGVFKPLKKRENWIGGFLSQASNIGFELHILFGPVVAQSLNGQFLASRNGTTIVLTLTFNWFYWTIPTVPFVALPVFLFGAPEIAPFGGSADSTLNRTIALIAVASAGVMTELLIQTFGRWRIRRQRRVAILMALLFDAIESP
jgi:hypothetical protein